LTVQQYDAIIIGAGQAGAPLAKKLANAGKKVALIEKRWVGGTCINDGCTPTKTWVASARAAYIAGNSAAIGVTTKAVKINMRLIKKRKDDLVKNAREGSQKALEKTKNLDLIFGDAAFSGDKALTIALNSGKVKEIKADQIFINTGNKTIIPPIEGLGDIPYLTSTSILELDKVPEHLLIIGANYIGLEFGQMFRRFGSKVTLLEKAPRILSKEDKDVADSMHQILTDEDITIHTQGQAIGFKKTAKGNIKATITVAGKEQSVKCTHVLIAVGRAPQTDTLNLPLAGVKTDERGFVKVNDKLETNIPGIYALGDVKGGPAFTQIAYNDYTIVYRNLIEGKNLSIKDRPVPYCMFTDPQLGRIGITEDEAKAKKLKNIKAVTLPMSRVARAAEVGDTRGLMKAVINTKTKKILGAAIIGTEGGEIMSVLQMAMAGGMTYEEIRYFVFAHPTYSESLNNLFMNIDD
jgi:pyruvate/2-oxoglutarate dehydrogenase complex dihydrolipoamide dehydrogenase (E3) component